MKFYKLLLAGIFVMLLSVNLFAQDKEMTKEEWQNEINRLTEKRVSLTTELNALKAEIANLKKMNESLKAYDTCIDELYAMLGAKKSRC